MNLKGRNFLTLKDFTPEEIEYLIDLSAELKAKKKLYIFCPKERYNKSLETSRFVNEIMNKEKAEE